MYECAKIRTFLVRIQTLLKTPTCCKRMLIILKSAKRSNKISNSFFKKSADNALENKVTSVVKSSKVGGATDEDETAHFVFFDMED